MLKLTRLIKMDRVGVGATTSVSLLRQAIAFCCFSIHQDSDSFILHLPLAIPFRVLVLDQSDHLLLLGLPILQ